MTPRSLIALCLACTLVGAIGGGIGGEMVRGWRQSKDIAKAEAKHEEQNTLSKQAGEHAAKAEALEQIVSELKARLERNQPAQGGGKPPRPAVAVASDAVPAVDGLKDQIIAAQDRQIEELKAEVGDLRSALKAADGRAEYLQNAIQHQPRIYRYALGPEITSDGYRGLSYEFTANRVTVGGSVVFGRANGARDVRGTVRIMGRW